MYYSNLPAVSPREESVYASPSMYSGYLSVYAILNKRRNLTTITNNNLSRIEENNKTPYQGACLNLIYKFDFGKKVKVKRAKSIQTTSDSYLRK